MSSLRPLLTLLLLAAVGVVLYMKINETEPVIPAGASDWTAAPLDIGGGAPVVDQASTAAAPAFTADAAPPFKPEPVATKPTAAPPGGDAPSWKPEPIAGASVTPTTPPPGKATPTADVKPNTVQSAPPELKLPEMPPMPGGSGDKLAAAAVTAAGAAPAFIPSGSAKNDPAANAPKVSAEQSATVATVNPADTPAAAGAPAPSATTDAPAPKMEEPITPTAEPQAAPAQASLFASVRTAVQAELERGELSQALLRLSDCYGDPSLTPAERQEVDTLLSQLAGSVIWEGPPAHRLEDPYFVQSGETLEDIGKKFDVPAELLAKINGIADPTSLQPGQELKVVRGKFSALIDLSERTMTLMLDRRYAGKFALELEPSTAVEEGEWKVEQKLLTPAGGGVYGQAGGGDDRSLLLANPTHPTPKAALLRGPGNSDPASPQLAGRVLRLKANDVADLYDILSVGSNVTIRR